MIVVDEDLTLFAIRQIPTNLGEALDQFDPLISGGWDRTGLQSKLMARLPYVHLYNHGLNVTIACFNILAFTDPVIRMGSGWE